MNKQRKVLITITYNEMGIIIDTKTEELGSSAQPEKRTEERTKTHACDSISRREALKMILGQPPEVHYPSWYAERIRELPPAVPKTGKWIDHRDEGYVECPFCRSATNCDGNIDELHYCFSCGAKMEG